MINGFMCANLDKSLPTSFFYFSTQMKQISFNKPVSTDREKAYLQQVLNGGHWSGNGTFTKQVQAHLSASLKGAKVLLTHSCTGALEMAALLLKIQPGDEVIMPSYTFVSTANAFVLRGAIPVWADSCHDRPHVDPVDVEAKITPKTKAIVVVHYAGAACDMEAISAIAVKHGIPLVEDAAQAINTQLQGSPLGSWGTLSAFSFHETKNIQSGEGGALVINDEALAQQAEIIWEKGTNRAAFSRGEVATYNWVGIGSSYLPAEFTAAILLAQLESAKEIQHRRMNIWKQYYSQLSNSIVADRCMLPNKDWPHNAHIFYLVLPAQSARDAFIHWMNRHGIQAIFHYLPLHRSPYATTNFSALQHLPHAEKYGQGLVRLPLHLGLSDEAIAFICTTAIAFFNPQSVSH